jgi:hypothetical protein
LTQFISFIEHNAAVTARCTETSWRTTAGWRLGEVEETAEETWAFQLKAPGGGK